MGSLETAGTQNFLGKLRRRGVAAIGASAVATSLFAANAAQAQAPGSFDHQTCKGIAGVIVGVYDDLGSRQKTSAAFQESIRRWLNVPNFTCDGPKDIHTPTGEDVATFNTIKQVLYASTNISLTAAGLRSIDPRRVDRPPALVPAAAPRR